MNTSNTPTHLWRSKALGVEEEVSLPQGRLQYFRRGAGPVVVFAHGWLANANLWRNVVARLADRFTCIALDLPLGAHRIAMDPDADLGPGGCGDLIAAALAALGLLDVTLVGNDSGGAYSQIAVASDPQRVARLVLNSCETPYSEFHLRRLTDCPWQPRTPRRWASYLRLCATRQSDRRQPLSACSSSTHSRTSSPILMHCHALATPRSCVMSAR